MCRLSIIAARLNGDNIISATVMNYSVDCVDYLLNGQKAALAKILYGDKRSEPTLGETLRQLYRLKPNLNQSALARALGYDRPNYINKELNKK